MCSSNEAGHVRVEFILLKQQNIGLVSARILRKADLVAAKLLPSLHIYINPQRARARARERDVLYIYICVCVCVCVCVTIWTLSRFWLVLLVDLGSFVLLVDLWC
jgi:hypothetical protein